MDGHLNRLNESESRIWDKCFQYFVRTGEWPDMKKANENMLYSGDYVSVPKFNDLSEGWYIDEFSIISGWVIIKHNVLRDSYNIKLDDLIHIRTNKPANEVLYHSGLRNDILNGSATFSHFDGKVAKITDDMLVAMDENPSPFQAPMVHGFMARPNYERDGRHPVSVDWFLEDYTFLCEMSGCAANVKKFSKGKCSMPSLIAINSHGKCTGYTPKKKKKKKNASKS